MRELSLTIVIGAVTLLIFKGTFEKQYTLGEMVLLLQLLNQARWPLFECHLFYLAFRKQRREPRNTSGDLGHQRI